MRQEEILAVAGAILVLVLLCCGGLAVLLSKKREVAKAEAEQRPAVSLHMLRPYVLSKPAQSEVLHGLLTTESNQDA